MFLQSAFRNPKAAIMMMRRSLSATTSLLVVLLLLLLCMSTISYSQTAPLDEHGSQPVTSLPFAPGEQLVYEAEFSKLLLRGIDIADFHFATEQLPPAAPPATAPATMATERNAPPLRFTGEATSKGWFQKLFGLHFRLRFESTVAPDTLLIERTVKHDEQGKRVRTSEAVFDRAANTITWTERDPNAPTLPPRVVTAPLDGAAHDIISSLHYIRAQPLAPGIKFDLMISDSGRVYRVPVRATKIQDLRTVLGKVSTLAVQFDIFGKDQLVPGKGAVTVWFTTDVRRIPVRAQITSPLGTLDITLKRVSGITSPQSSRNDLRSR